MPTTNGRSDPEETSTFLHHPNVKKNKWVIIVLVFLTILCIVLLSLVLFFALRKQADDDICLTKDCALTASILIDAMDTTVDPCQNFQKFGCGNFMRKHPVADDQTSLTTWKLFNTYFDLQMKDVFETLNPYGQPDVIFRMQEAYHVCINTTDQPEKEMEAFKNYTIDFLQWPLASGDKWRPKLNLTSLLIKMCDGYAGGIPFYITANRNENDSAIVDITIDPEPLYLFVNEGDIVDEENDDDENVEERKIMEKAEMMILNDLMELFKNNNSESIDKDIEDMKKFSKYEKQWQASSEEYREKMSIEELTDLFDFKIDWLQVLNKKLEKENYTLSPKDVVTFPKPEKIARTVDIIKHFPYRIINNILGWHTIFPRIIKIAGPLGEKLIEKYYVSSPNYEPEKPKKKWLDCLDELQRIYPMAMTRMFVNKYINRSDKTSANEMIQWIQKAYRAAISQSPWVDEETKKNAIKKADNIRRFVGYPDFIFDDAALDKEYASMPEIKSTHFQNAVSHQKIRDETRWLTTADLKSDRWFVFPLEVNAFYNPFYNSICFPTGILQLPFFDDTRLAAVNFGMIGSIIGHEIGHAFDNTGSTFDEFGDERNWWTNETRTLFENKAQCFVQQFNDYCPEELKGDENETFCVNGERTLGENLADFTGILASFSAYKMWVKEHGQEKRLPGLQEYSPEQVFFISLAYTWCENISPDKWSRRYEYDSHSPAYYRILGPLSNSKEFRETFNCPEGPMNRGKDSCSMW